MVPAPLAHLPSPPHRLLLCHLCGFLQCRDQDEKTAGRHPSPRIFLHYLLLVQGFTDDYYSFTRVFSIKDSVKVTIIPELHISIISRFTSCSATSPC